MVTCENINFLLRYLSSSERRRSLLSMIFGISFTQVFAPIIEPAGYWSNLLCFFCICTVFLLNIFGTSLVFLGYLFSISLVYLWHFFCMFLVLLQYFFGIFLTQVLAAIIGPEGYWSDLESWQQGRIYSTVLYDCGISIFPEFRLLL